MPNLPDPLSRSPRFEELRARAERAVVDTLSLVAEFQATLEEVRWRWGLGHAWAPHEEHVGQATDPSLSPSRPRSSKPESPTGSRHRPA
jgi:hypothetical protein